MLIHHNAAVNKEMTLPFPSLSFPSSSSSSVKLFKGLMIVLLLLFPQRFRNKMPKEKDIKKNPQKTYKSN